jgi:hypothetical protein
MSKPEMTEAEKVREVRLAFENIRDGYVGWQDNPNFNVIENVLFGAMSQRERTGEAVGYLNPNNGSIIDINRMAHLKEHYPKHKQEHTEPVYTSPPSPPSSRELLEKLRGVIMRGCGFYTRVEALEILDALIPQEPSKEEGNV